MIRPKSGSNWKGTLYEYEKKTRKSCYICSHANDGFCVKQNVDIRSIGAGFYRHCKYFDDPEKSQEDAPSHQKVFDAKEFQRTRQNPGQADQYLKGSVVRQPTSTSKKNDPGDSSRFHEKTHIGGKHKPNAKKKPGVKSLTLRKILNDERITVKFVDRVSFTNRSSTIFEVTATSSTGKLLNRAKKGDMVEFNGFRCLVQDISY